MKTSFNGQNSYEQSCALSCKSTDFQCCQTDNCNNVTVKPVVSSCYVGGTVKFESGIVYNIPMNKTPCVSPKNQFCMVFNNGTWLCFKFSILVSLIYFITKTQKGKFTGVAMDAKVCADACFAVISDEFMITCCQRDNCNTISVGASMRTFSLLNLLLVLFCCYIF